MFYASQVHKRRVWDAFGDFVGRCTDILVGPVEERFPPLRALAIRDSNGQQRFIPASCVSSLYPSITLNVPAEQCPEYTASDDDLWLIDRVLDRQIVDTEGRVERFVQRYARYQKKQAEEKAKKSTGS